MQIKSIQSFNGRNIYSHKPVIKMTVDLGDLYDIPTKNIEGFNEGLLTMFPGLMKHYCSLGYEGGFAARLREGTYMAHVSEHLILELQSLMGYDVYFGKARVFKEPSLYFIIVEYMNEKCGIECCKAGIDIANSLTAGQAADHRSILDSLRRITSEAELGPSSRTIKQEAARRGIPVTRIGNESLLQLGYGKNSRLVQASLSDAPSCISVDIVSNKHLTKQILSENKIPVPAGDVIYTEDSAVALAEEIGYPVVLKPYNANQGKGVTLNIKNSGQIRLAYREALKHSKGIIVEKYIKGRDFRVLVVGNKVSAVSERRPPFVVGDGVRNIRELVELENQNPLRGDDHEKPLTRIRLDGPAIHVLSMNGFSTDYIPAAGEAVRLRDNGNLSTGGTARDCTDEIHPYNISLAVRIAGIFELDIAGIDITAEDISLPLGCTNGAVIEVNAAPGLRMHVHPSEGKPRNVASDIFDMLFPEGRPFSIPIVSVTGTNGKTTVTRLISHTLGIMGKNVGMTTTSGVYIGGKCISKGDNTGPVSADMVLSNKEVEAAVLETARGGIVKRGLGYDLADVGVITNISEDHIGLDGLETIEDLAHAKALVIEALKPDGHAVLNADDGMVEYFLERAAGNVILFSKEAGNLLVRTHLENGGRALYTEDGTVYIHYGKRKKPLVKIEEIPMTYNGMLECNIENSLAAACALFALNIPLSVIREGLMSFKPDSLTNPGRFNIFEIGNIKVMLDYGHNIAGYREVVNFARRMKPDRLVGVVGVPGDRINRSMQEVGELCGRSFDRLYIKEDRDLRGRAPGEVAGLLYESAVNTGIRKENVNVIIHELKALESAILDSQPGDLIIMLYEELEPAVGLIEKFQAEFAIESLQPDIEIEHVG